jgi:hypothetical protein
MEQSVVIERGNDQITVVVTTSQTTTPTIPYQGFSQGEVLVPSGTSITTLTWYVSNDDSTYYAAYDSAATPAAVTQSVGGGKGYPIPASLAGARYLRVKGDAAGTIYVSLKV